MQALLTKEQAAEYLGLKTPEAAEKLLARLGVRKIDFSIMGGKIREAQRLRGFHHMLHLPTPSVQRGVSCVENCGCSPISSTRSHLPARSGNAPPLSFPAQAGREAA